MPCALAAQSRDGLTEGGLKAREWIVEVVVPRRKVNALLTSGRRNTRMTVPFCEAEASRLPSWFHAITVCTHNNKSCRLLRHSCRMQVMSARCSNTFGASINIVDPAVCWECPPCRVDRAGTICMAQSDGIKCRARPHTTGVLWASTSQRTLTPVARRL